MDTSSSLNDPHVLAAEALERIDEIARYSEILGALTRTFLSAPMKSVHQLLEFWMRDAGMTVRIDAIGNVIGRIESRQPDAKTLLLGSHIDTVPNAGRYAGTLGVLLGIALAKSIRGRQLSFALEVIAFSEGEGVRFETPFLGSRAIAGSFDSALLDLTDMNAVTLRKAILDFGLEPESISDAAYSASKLLGFLEIYIEQGAVLDTQNLPLGLVSGITGQTRISLEFHGQAAHAGTTPMHLRQDALMGAAAFMIEVERITRTHPGLVTTVGQLNVLPGISNVIPAQAQLSLDIRHLQDDIRHRVVAELLDLAWHVAQRRKLEFKFNILLEQNAVFMDSLLTDFLGDALEDSHQKRFQFPAGTEHDAAMLAPVTRSAMLFVRCPKGITHHPDEAVIPTDITAALRVMIEFVNKCERWQVTI